MEMQRPRTLFVNEHLDIRRRLEQLDIWRREVEREDTQLVECIRQFDLAHPADRHLGIQLARRRRLLRKRFVREPLEISFAAVEQVSYRELRRHFVEQFAQLSKDERHLWLNNFQFIVIPEVRLLINKLISIGQRDHSSQHG